MDIAQAFWYTWPWMGLGMAIVMLILLFGTNVLRSKGGRRWLDPVWLAWAAMPLYLIHQFEEYACNIVDGKYLIIDQVFANAGGILDLSGLPMAYFPAVNIGLAWIAVPLAALICRKNPVIGLAPYGFVLVNGLMHCVGTLTGLMPIADNPGFWTGTFLFLPMAVLVIYATLKERFMSGGALAVSYVSGLLGHVLLGMGYAASAIGGPAAALCVGVFAVFAPLIFAWLGCKVFHVRYIAPANGATTSGGRASDG